MMLLIYWWKKKNKKKWILFDEKKTLRFLWEIDKENVSIKGREKRL